MRNEFSSKISRILRLVNNLPYFNLADLLTVEKNIVYLKILLSRNAAKGKLFRLKRGVYVSADYISRAEKNGRINDYNKFIANIINEPSYLSLDSALYEYGILTDMPINFTSVTANKTSRLNNHFGKFIYRHVKPDLFIGFNIVNRGDLVIKVATPAKAVFDYVYLRKNFLADDSAIDELRLNLGNLTADDVLELKRYVTREGSKKIRKIFMRLL